MACSRRRRQGGGSVEREVAGGPRLGSRSFFKIILADALASGKLGIPKSFLRRCGKVLSNSVLLKVPGSSTWTIELEKCNNDMVLLWKGWWEFMEHYSIGHVPIDTDPEEPNLFQAQAGLTDMIKQPTCSASHSELVFHGPTLPRPPTTPEFVRKSDPEHPCFKKTIWQSHTARLDIPSGFIKQHIQQKQRATLRYANRSWSVRLIRGNGRVGGVPYRSFSTGWHAFARETHLRVGNVCVFKLIDRNDIVFEVSILSVRRRNKLSKRRVNHYELAFRGPTPPKPPNTPELASEFESEQPFFKVVIQQRHERNVYIPGQFAKQHIQENKEMVTLRFSDKSWPVRLLVYSHETRVFFSAGWPAFARETHLCMGNICVFELIDRDDVVFQVSVFSSAGGIKIPRCRASCSGLDFHGPTLLKALKSSDLASNIDSEHPFFILVIPRCCISCLGVPVGFAKQHLQEHKRIATLRYLDRSWPVKILRSHRQATGTTTLSFSAGWRAFARETHLRGNVCLFELIGSDDTLFKVSILSSAGNNPVHVDRDEHQKYYLRPLQHRNDSQGS